MFSRLLRLTKNFLTLIHTLNQFIIIYFYILSFHLGQRFFLIETSKWRTLRLKAKTLSLTWIQITIFFWSQKVERRPFKFRKLSYLSQVLSANILWNWIISIKLWLFLFYTLLFYFRQQIPIIHYCLLLKWWITFRINPI